MTNTIFLFDVDGTLAESSQQISNKMKTALMQIKLKGYDIGIVGGGRFEKIIEQLDGLCVDHIFAESGCVYFRNNNFVYKKNVRTHSLYPLINVIIKRALCFIANVDYEITGHFVDLRNGIVYISLIGMCATQKERDDFIYLDNKNKYRQQLLQILQNLAKQMKIEKDLVIAEGGSVGIGIYPKEWDKTQVLEWLPYKTIHFFGDKYEENGNDFYLINHPQVHGHPVKNPKDCLDLLEQIIVTSL
jgi:phosphomannomutase